MSQNLPEGNFERAVGGVRASLNAIYGFGALAIRSGAETEDIEALMLGISLQALDTVKELTQGSYDSSATPIVRRLIENDSVNARTILAEHGGLDLQDEGIREFVIHRQPGAQIPGYQYDAIVSKSWKHETDQSRSRQVALLHLIGIPEESLVA